MKSISFFKRIRAQERLTPSEARIVEHMEQAFPVLALESVSTICEEAKVGRATVVRFVQKLGYESFAAFQQELRSELAHRLLSPKERFEDKKAKYPQENLDLFHVHCDQVIENINEAKSRIDSAQLQSAARMLAGCRGKIFIMGNRSSFALAFLLHFGLSYLRDDVILCNAAGGGISDGISHIRPDDILVLVYKRRYSTVTTKMGRWFADHGCHIVLLTDRETTPLTRAATVQFTIPSEGFGIFDSRAASIAVIETIVNMATLELEDGLDERSRRAETVAETFGIFSGLSRFPAFRAKKISALRDKEAET
jgi:DNA-binding MurR/RpiR family transcriptional regulator